MATLFVQWQPRASELRLLALGEIACSELGWAARCLRDRHGLQMAERLDVRCFGDIELTGATRWHLEFITPWVIAKNVPNQGRAVPPDIQAIEHELYKSMTSRAHKFTALCSHDPVWQRLGAHLARHVADVLLPAALRVEDAEVELVELRHASKANPGVFDALAWAGEVTLTVTEAALPWLSLLAVCGGGENADKGFGCVEITPAA